MTLFSTHGFEIGDVARNLTSVVEQTSQLGGHVAAFLSDRLPKQPLLVRLAAARYGTSDLLSGSRGSREAITIGANKV